MIAAEFPQFEALMRKLEKLYGKSVDDETIQAYWHALRELPLALVTRRIEEHIKRQKFFPKPVELRPKESAPVEYDTKARQEFDVIVARNVAGWNERLRLDPVGTKWLLLEAYAARVDVQEDHSSVIYAERMAFARETARKLLRESGPAYAGADFNRRRVVNELIGPQELMNCIAAFEAQRKATAA